MSNLATVSQYSATIKVLNFYTVTTLETSTETTVTITSHGLETDDFFVNITERAQSLLGAERGSRKVTVVDSNTFTINPAISDQTAGNESWLFKWFDRTDKLMDGSFKLNLKADGQHDLNFTLNTEFEEVE